MKKIQAPAFLASLKTESESRPPEGAFTRQDVMDMGYAYMTAVQRLRQAVAAGTLSTGMFLNKGRHTHFYWEN